MAAGGLLHQASIPVQVPISTSNGQTVYQTVHFPLQAFAQQPQPQMVPSQMQIIPQLAQVSRDEYYSKLFILIGKIITILIFSCKLNNQLLML